MTPNPFQDQVDDPFLGRHVRVYTATDIYEGWVQIREYNKNAVLLRDAERNDGEFVGDVVVHEVKKLELCDSDTTIKQVAIESLKPSPYTQRSFDTANFREFVRTVRDRGHLISLPVIRPVDEEQYEIVSGHRRYEAAQRAGLDTIAAEIRGLNDWEATTIFLDEHVPTSRDEAATASDPYSGFYVETEIEAALDALRADWSDEQLHEHPALGWYLETESHYPNDDENEESIDDDVEDGDDEKPDQ